MDEDSKENITLKWGKLFDIVKNYYSAKLAVYNNNYTQELTVVNICSYLRANYSNNIKENWKSVTVIIPKDLTLEQVRAFIFR
jgi:hypothetical protein